MIDLSHDNETWLNHHFKNVVTKISKFLIHLIFGISLVHQLFS